MLQPASDLVWMIVVVCAMCAMQFFLVLNFTIAIIVESYDKAKAEVEQDDSDLGFLTDVSYSLYSSGLRISLGAPPTHVIIKHVSGLVNKYLSADVTAQAIKPATLHLTSAQRKRLALHLLKYFARFEALRPGNQRSAALTQDDKVVNKVACMLNQRVPTDYETMLAQHQFRRPLHQHRSSLTLSALITSDGGGEGDGSGGDGGDGGGDGDGEGCGDGGGDGEGEAGGAGRFVAINNDKQLAVASKMEQADLKGTHESRPEWRHRDNHQSEGNIGEHTGRPANGHHTMRRFVRRRKTTDSSCTSRERTSSTAPALACSALVGAESAELSETKTEASLGVRVGATSSHPQHTDFV